MTITVHLIFLTIAAILFIVAAAGIPTGPVGVQSLGLFFLTLAFIFA